MLGVYCGLLKSGIGTGGIQEAIPRELKQALEDHIRGLRDQIESTFLSVPREPLIFLCPETEGVCSLFLHLLATISVNKKGKERRQSDYR